MHVPPKQAVLSVMMFACRRALTLSPYDPKVLQNFDDYLRERLPGGAYGSTGPSQFVVRR